MTPRGPHCGPVSCPPLCPGFHANFYLLWLHLKRASQNHRLRLDYGPHWSQCAELQRPNDSLFGLIDPENAGEGKVTTRMTDSDTALCYSKVINIEPSLDAVSTLLGV